jgi:DNA polymerase
MDGVTNDYIKVLEATERHLQALKAGGVRSLAVASETLRQLREALPQSQRIPVLSVPAEEHLGATTRRTDDSLITSGGERARERGSFHQEVAEPPTGPLAPQDVEAAFAALQARAAVCVKCPHLASSRKNVVFGVGDIHATLMFVGEAPGADEDRQGEPFVGPAGQLLTRIIKTMGFSRQQVYIANILKCRPDTPGAFSGNRKPTGDEMKTCLPYLLEQIDLIRPQVIVALGATAVEGLLGKSEPIGRLRGRFQVFRGIPLMPTFHPSYLLRNAALTEKRKVWEDMLQVLEKLNLPISEKQRGYFLKG